MEQQERKNKIRRQYEIKRPNRDLSENLSLFELKLKQGQERKTCKKQEKKSEKRKRDKDQKIEQQYTKRFNRDDSSSTDENLSLFELKLQGQKKKTYEKQEKWSEMTKRNNAQKIEESDEEGTKNKISPKLSSISLEKSTSNFDLSVPFVKGDYVLVNYEDSHYPGLIKAVKNNEYKVSALHSTFIYLSYGKHMVQ